MKSLRQRATLEEQVFTFTEWLLITIEITRIKLIELLEIWVLSFTTLVPTSKIPISLIHIFRVVFLLFIAVLFNRNSMNFKTT